MELLPTLGCLTRTMRLLGALATLAVVGCSHTSDLRPSAPQPPSSLSGTQPAPPRTPKKNTKDTAQEFLELLASHGYQQAASRFDTNMAAVLPASALAAVWQSLEKRAGSLVRLHEIERIPRPPRTHVWLACELERQTWHAEVVVDGANRVSGLRLAPAPEPWTAPPYAEASRFTEKRVSVGWPPLDGTLAAPVDRADMAVVLLHGSGPQDADGSWGPAGTGTKILKDLAWGLASRGIGAFRYPKRTWAQPELFEGQAFTLDDEVIRDACAAVAMTAASLQLPHHRVYLVGHSLGAALTPRVAGSCPRVGGFVLLAGPSRPLDDVLHDQLEYLLPMAGKSRAEVASELGELLAGFASSSLTVAPSDEEVIFAGMRGPRSYWSDVDQYDPQTAMTRAPIRPVLILQGGRDYQVTEVDFDGWKRVLRTHPDASFRRYPSLDHRFVSGVGPPSPIDYNQTGHVDAQVIADIVAWLRKHGSQP